MSGYSILDHIYQEYVRSVLVNLWRFVLALVLGGLLGYLMLKLSRVTVWPLLQGIVAVALWSGRRIWSFLTHYGWYVAWGLLTLILASVINKNLAHEDAFVERNFYAVARTVPPMTVSLANSVVDMYVYTREGYRDRCVDAQLPRFLCPASFFKDSTPETTSGDLKQIEPGPGSTSADEDRNPWLF